MNERMAALGLLLLRVSGAAALWSFHVQHKLANWSVEWTSFPDPIGVGHAGSLLLALSAEAGCSLLVMIGLAARLACLPIVATMSMVLILRARGFAEADVEAALLYAALYGALALLGPGPLVVARLRLPKGGLLASARDA